MEPTVRLRRIYDPPSAADGYRVLVDGLWPRGLRRETAAVDEWLRQAAPSQELRIWYGHDIERFPEFRHRYLAELAEPRHAAVIDRLRAKKKVGPLTLLTATRDIEHSHAAVLAEALSGSNGKER